MWLFNQTLPTLPYLDAIYMYTPQQLCNWVNQKLGQPESGFTSLSATQVERSSLSFMTLMTDIVPHWQVGWLLWHHWKEVTLVQLWTKSTLYFIITRDYADKPENLNNTLMFMYAKQKKMLLWLTELDESRGADFPRPKFRIRRRLEPSSWVPLLQLRFKPKHIYYINITAAANTNVATQCISK